MKLVFWQSMVTPHQSPLVRALNALPGVSVTYVAAEQIEGRRADMGWTPPDLGGAELHIAPDEAAISKLAATFDEDAVHLCQGFRGNGAIAAALPALAARGARVGVMMEAIDQRGLTGWLKQPVYRQRIRSVRDKVQFCLTIGRDAAGFITRSGYPAELVFPFSYFLEPAPPGELSSRDRFRIVYVGQLIELKRVDLLIEALGRLRDNNIRLTVVGDGPLRAELSERADRILGPDCVEWAGSVAPERARELIQQSDCLVLPSEYDGWGAVVSEALLSGVPGICSDACGAAEAVQGSGVGAVFRSKDVSDLATALEQQIAEGTPNAGQRLKIARWAQGALSGAAGADYLLGVLKSLFEDAPRPTPPWRAENP